jgi:hypothetical protein
MFICTDISNFVQNWPGGYITPKAWPSVFECFEMLCQGFLLRKALRAMWADLYFGLSHGDSTLMRLNRSDWGTMVREITSPRP